MVGGWRLMAVGGGWWRLMAVGGGWWRLVAVGGWWRLAAGGRWRLAVGVRWRLAVGGSWHWWSLGAVLKGCPKTTTLLSFLPGLQLHSLHAVPETHTLWYWVHYCTLVPGI